MTATLYCARVTAVRADNALADFAGGSAPRRKARDFPNRPIKMLVGFARRRQHRCRRAHRGAEDVGNSRPDGSGREPHRRQRTACRRGRGEIAARRLHADDGEPDRARGGAAALSQGDGRSGQGFCRRCTYCGASPLVLVVNPSFPAHTHRRDHRHGQSRSRQDHFRHRRRRHHAAHRVRNVPISSPASRWRTSPIAAKPARSTISSPDKSRRCSPTCPPSRASSRPARVRALAVTSPQRAPRRRTFRRWRKRCPALPPKPGSASSRRPERRTTSSLKLNAAAQQALADDDTKKRYADLGMTNRRGSTPRAARCLYQVRGRQMVEGHRGRQHSADGLSMLHSFCRNPAKT